MEYKIREKLFGANKTSAIGMSLTLNDTVKYPINKLTIDGVCEQNTTTGKNLLDYVSNLKLSNNGLTSVINDDGSITTSGKPTADYSTITKQIDITDILEDGSTYTISQSVPAKLFVQINIRKLDGTLKYANSNRGSSSFIVDKSIYSSYTLVIQTTSMETWGDSSLTITNKYMLCKGTDTADTLFEPYTGGQASPSPDYPQEIKTLTGNLKLTSCGKNLFDSSFRKANGTLTVAHGTCTETNGIFTLKATDADIYLFDLLNPSFFYNEECGPLIKIPKNNSGKLFFKNTNSLFTKNYITQYDENKKSLGASYISSNVGYVTIKSNAKYCSIRTGYSKSVANEEYKFSIMLSINDIPYEPYQGSSLNITIPSNEFVGKLDDTYKDTLNVVYKDDGPYHLILKKMIGKVVLDGSADEIWTVQLTNASGKSRLRLDASKFNMKTVSKINEIGKIISTCFLPVSVERTWFNYNGIAVDPSKYIFIYSEETSNLSLTDFKNWLSTHNVEAYYALKTPYEVDLGIVDTLLTYDEITNIISDSDLYPVINVDYYKGSLDISNYEFSIKEV